LTIIYGTLAVAIIMIAVECLVPGRSWPQVSRWWLRAVAFNLAQIGCVFLAGVAWNKWMLGASLWSVEPALGIIGGAVFGYIVLTFIYYWWHRARHEVDFLWRWFHQIHHSPQRIEIITSFYKHPAELVANSVLSSFILYVLVGLKEESATLVVLMTGLAELFYHWNVKTPYWVGFIFQRPESHCIHHQQNWHKNNFSDLPVWDILFGTFQNSKNFEASCGFSDHKELHLTEMLLAVDVNKTSNNSHEETSIVV
jgi:sterol desaturase/sphingolipid hydroxylase (fatty acid hydroxylase superfamily)